MFIHYYCHFFLFPPHTHTPCFCLSQSFYFNFLTFYPHSGPLSVTNRKNGSITGTGTGSSNLTSPLAGLRYSLPGPIVTEHSQCNPLPIEIDVESVNGKKLMAAVCGFSAIMAAHLETYVHTFLDAIVFITKIDDLFTIFF